MKKHRRVAYGIALACLAGMPALAGLLEECLSSSGGGHSDTCGVVGSMGVACSGDCYDYFTTNIRQCYPAWWWCGGTSTRTVTKYYGECQPPSCPCVIDPGAPGVITYPPNECS